MTPACRFCRAPLRHTVVDLGMSPLANAYLTAEQCNAAEKFYPLHARVCERCLLVQLEEFEAPDEIFGDYAYFSSYSDSWLRHARAYVDAMIERFGFGPASRVVEVASNDGYLLQYFVARGIPVLGVEPAANVAAVAEARGIPSLVKFFGTETAQGLVAAGQGADLLLGNNVLAHVPDLNDFVGGMATALNPGGVLTMEFPHLLRLVEESQFDTIYHEHFSYFSFLTVRQVFAAHGLTLFDVEELPTHGGSLRIYGCHTAEADAGGRTASDRVAALEEKERRAGLDRIETYTAFGARAEATKRRLLTFLIAARDAGRTVVGYGAPAKGNTLLNYCGVRGDFIEYTVDRSPHKQGQFLPGTHIPICSPDRIRETRPDYVLILPWNLREEIMAQTQFIGEWGGRFVTPIPEPRIWEPAALLEAAS